jgi:colicin import membrane protein
MQFDKSLPFPVLLSVALHAGILALIFGNWDLFTKEEQVYEPRYITATLVDIKPQAKAAPPQIKEQNLDAKQYEDLKNLKKQEEQKRKEAEASAKKEEAAKAIEVEKEKQKKMKEEEAKIAKAKAEAEQKAKREQAAQEEQRRIQAALQKEEKIISDSNDAANVKSYNDLLSERVAQNWSRPPSARKGMTAFFTIDMLPNGLVVNVTLSQSSGDSAFDRSAEQAIKKVERFTEIKDIPIDVFERNFRRFQFAFNPEDLRQ